MQRLLPGAVIILIALFFVTYNIHYSVNFPYQDDFLLIQFIEVIQSEKLGFLDTLTEMFKTFNDHKAAVPRGIALVEYHLTGHLNFRFYIVLVSGNIVYIFYFLYAQFRKMKLPLYYFIPAPFLFFQPLYHDISGWALNGMQHTFLTAFTVTAIMLASKRTSVAFGFAMLCCFCATFTHGNGILSFPAIIFLFLCYQDIRRAIWTAVWMFVCFGIYVIGYESGQAVNLPTSLINMFASLFGFIGSSMSLWGLPVLTSALAGVVIVGFMIFLIIKIGGVYFKRQAYSRPGYVELLTLFIFILITSSVIALFRSWAGSTIASRFQIYASLSIVIFYILALDYFPALRKKVVLYTIIVFSVFYWGYSFYKFTGMVSSKRTVYLADVYNWSTNHNMFSVEKSITRNGDFYLTPAYRKGFFKVPQPVVSKWQLDSMFATSAVPATDFKMYLEPWEMERITRDTTEVLVHYFLASNELPGRKDFLDDRFLVLREKANGKMHLMSGNPKLEARKTILTQARYFKTGFNTFLRIDDLAPGSYDLGVLDVNSSGRRIFYRLNRPLQVSASDLKLL